MSSHVALPAMYKSPILEELPRYCLPSCSTCCHETAMLLSERDTCLIEQVTSLTRDDFSFVNSDGFRQLRNIDGKCYFLSRDGKCRIYPFRPLGCRLYPFIWDIDSKELLVDDECPNHSHFLSFPAAQLLPIIKSLAFDLLSEKIDSTP